MTARELVPGVYFNAGNSRVIVLRDAIIGFETVIINEEKDDGAITSLAFKMNDDVGHLFYVGEF